MGWLIALAVLCGLCFVPIGVRGIYREDNPGIWLLIGPVKYLVFPGKPKEKKPKEKTKSVKGKQTQQTGTKKQRGGSYQNFKPVITTVIELLGHFRRKIRVNHLEMKLILAGGDPSDLAVNYGKAWIAVGNLMPQLERLFVIKKRNVKVECDFAGDKTLVYFRVDATITLGRTIHLLSHYGIKVLKELLKLKKLQKGGAKL